MLNYSLTPENNIMSTTKHHPLILTVFFEGTANPLDSFITQIGLFAELTDAIDLVREKVERYKPGQHYKIAFDG